MANSGGGTLIIGVANRNGIFTLEGISPEDAPRYETTKLNDAIEKYVSSSAHLSTRFIRHEGLQFAFVQVYPTTDTVALATVPNEKAGLYPGRIYVRTQSGKTTEATNPLEVRRLIDRLVESRLTSIRPENTPKENRTPNISLDLTLGELALGAKGASYKVGRIAG